MATSTSTASLPAYRGRVLDDEGTAVGSRFWVRPGVVVTAHHVLLDIGAAEVGDGVHIAPWPAARPSRQPSP